MSFDLEVTKNGKDFIIYNNYKYRETYSLKSGDIVWRCLGKNCKATVKTDKDKKGIYFTNEEHRGIHPVTLRSLAPSPPQRRLLVDQATPTPSISTPNGPKSFTDGTPSHNVLTPSHATTSTPTNSDVTNNMETLETTRTQTEDLKAENCALREELSALREEMQVILDHSIESDQRLLQFTGEVFLPPGRSSQSVLSSTSVLAPSYVDCAVQCDPQTACFDDRCSANIELIDNLRTTISVLEAEVQLLRSEAMQSRCKICDTPSEVSSLHGSVEMTMEDDVYNTQGDADFTVVTNRKIRKQKKNTNNVKDLHNTRKVNTVSSHKPTGKAVIPFKTITVLGDSHVRDLARNIQNRVKEDISVTGVCKPGAGLLSMFPATEPSTDHCYVLMAGTNDVDAGREDVIFSQLGNLLQSCERSSSVLLVPLPTRYDLSPDNPRHRTVLRVNRFMAEICQRHEGVELLDIGNITRRHFTRHGLHLGGNGKRLLANLIVRRLSGLRTRVQTGGVRHVASEVLTSPVHHRTTSQDSYATIASRLPCTKKQARSSKPQDIPSQTSFL